MKNLLLMLIGFSLFGCDKTDFPKYSLVNDLRVLALVADHPEVSPGDSVSFTPWVSDVNNTAPLTYTATACKDPGLASGQEPTCDGSSSLVSVGTGTISTLNAGNVFTGPADSFSVSVPADLLTGRSPISLYNGIDYLVTYTVTNASGKTVKSFKRMTVSDPSKGTKNQNPGISQLLANGATFTTLATNGSYALGATFTPGSDETYQIQLYDGSSVTKTEEMVTTWFLSDGTLKYQRTVEADTDTYSSPGAYPATRGSFIMAVTRDGRGGICVQQVKIN